MYPENMYSIPSLKITVPTNTEVFFARIKQMLATAIEIQNEN